MAKKKRQTPKSGFKRGPKANPKRRAKVQDELPIRLPDFRSFESIFRDLFAKAGTVLEETPLDKAQDVIYQAFGEPDPKRRVKLAKKALDLSPDCADAYLLLAEDATERKQALELYEQAVAAGVRALGPDVFREHVGHFWGLLETRPYMRAREGLAHTLWTVGRREEAAEHLRDLLWLNPGDNQGVRYALTSWLLDLGRDEEVAELLARYDEVSANWAYARALLTFRREGDSPEARKTLKAAKKVNKHVPQYLLGERPLPIHQPESYGFGDESEAILYTASALPAWRSTSGAITWVRSVLKSTSRKKRADELAASGPSPIGKARLNRLPRRFETWQADSGPLDCLIESAPGGALVQPWMTLVASPDNELIMAQAMSPEPPTAAVVWDALARGMGEPTMVEPHRPTHLQVRPGAIWDELRPHLDEIGVECVEVEELPQVRLLLDDLAQYLRRDEPPGLLDTPGVTPEQVAGFYAAAAEFYRRTPWKALGFDQAIRVGCDRYKGGPWYALVMGQSGMTLGLVLYDDLALLRQLLSSKGSDEQNARRTVALTVTFDTERDMGTADLLAAREFGWEVAGPEAYPSIFRKERGLKMRLPQPWELELMEGCLRAIPIFAAGQQGEDTSTRDVSAPVVSGELKLTLSWVSR